MNDAIRQFQAFGASCVADLPTVLASVGWAAENWIAFREGGMWWTAAQLMYLAVLKSGRFQIAWLRKALLRWSYSSLKVVNRQADQESMLSCIPSKLFVAASLAFLSFCWHAHAGSLVPRHWALAQLIEHALRMYCMVVGLASWDCRATRFAIH